MLLPLAVCVLSVGFFQAQVTTPAASTPQSANPPITQEASPAPGIPEPHAAEKMEKKVSLVRGVLKQIDPIHDQLLVRTFGGGQLRINFDGRTQLFAENKAVRLTGLPAGSVVSVDTVVDEGKLFARSVRTGTMITAEVEGQIVQYDSAKSQISVHDPMSPEAVSLHITPDTTIINQNQPSSAQALSSGMLVRVNFDAAQHTAAKVEILAAPGNSFTFQGRVIAVDLRARVLSIFNNTDQDIHDLAIGSLDVGSIGLLREGAEVNIQAEFDGGRYNARSVALVPHNP
jgi:hypothetical protein